MLAALSGAPVVPVYIQGSGRALARGWSSRPVRVTVTFGAPIRFARERGRTRYQDVSDEIASGHRPPQDESSGDARQPPPRTHVRITRPRGAPAGSNSLNGGTGMDQFTQDPEAHANGQGGGAGTGAPWEVGEGPDGTTDRTTPAAGPIAGGSARDAGRDRGFLPAEPAGPPGRRGRQGDHHRSQ